MSYVPTSPARGGSSSSMPKVATIVGAFLAACLLIVSVLLGYGAHTRAAQAEETRADTESLRTQKKDIETETAGIRTQITTAQADKAASRWCDDFTAANSDLDTLSDKAIALISTPADRLAAITRACPKKKEFAEAYRDATGPIFEAAVTDCTLSGDSVSLTGEMSINNAAVSKLGPFEVTVDLLLTEKKATKDDTPVGSTSFVIPADGKGTFTYTLPSGGMKSGHCSFLPTHLWPKDL